MPGSLEGGCAVRARGARGECRWVGAKEIGQQRGFKGKKGAHGRMASSAGGFNGVDVPKEQRGGGSERAAGEGSRAGAQQHRGMLLLSAGVRSRMKLWRAAAALSLIRVFDS